MKFMTLEEYKRQVAKDFRELCEFYPKDEVEAYLKEHEQNIERGYWEALSISKKWGRNEISPSGCAYVMSLEF